MFDYLKRGHRVNSIRPQERDSDSQSASEGGSDAPMVAMESTNNLEAQSSTTNLAAGPKKNTKPVVTSVSRPNPPSPASGPMVYPPGMVPMQPWPYQAPPSSQGQQRMMYSQPGYSTVSPYRAQVKPPEPEPEKKPLQMYIVPKTLRKSASQAARASQSPGGSRPENQEKTQTRTEILEVLDKVIDEEKTEMERTSDGQSKRQVSREKSGKDMESDPRLEQLKRAYKKVDTPKETLRRPSVSGERSSDSKQSFATDEGMSSTNDAQQGLHKEVIAEEDYPSTHPAAPPAPAPAELSLTTRLARLMAHQEQERAVEAPRTAQQEAASRVRDEEREAAEEWERRLQAEKELLRKRQEQLPVTESSCQTEPASEPAMMVDSGVQVQVVTEPKEAEKEKEQENSVPVSGNLSLAELMGVPAEKIAAFAHSSHLILERMLLAKESLVPKRSKEVESFIASAASTSKDAELPYNIALAAASLMKKQEPGQAANNLDDIRARHEQIADNITARLNTLVTT